VSVGGRAGYSSHMATTKTAAKKTAKKTANKTAAKTTTTAKTTARKASATKTSATRTAKKTSARKTSARSKPSTDAIVLLKDDHKEIRGTFDAFEKAGENAEKRKGQLVDKMIELLTVHTYIENEVMYPRVRALLPDLEDDVLESYEEHHVADVLVMELANMKPSDERFDAKTTVLIENVRHHIEEEEQEWFPKVRDGLGRNQLQEIGAEMQQARKKAPRRPSQPSALKKTIDAVIA
jgi:hemerythrin-like domain-containing protein